MISATCRACLLVILAGLAACASQPPAPIESPASASTTLSQPVIPPKPVLTPAKPVTAVTNGRYVVRRGDTLYAIAWRLGVDHRDIVRWNSLSDPDRILVGQSLQVTGPRPPPSRATPVAPAAKPLPSVAMTAPPATQPPATAPARASGTALQKPVASAPAKGRWIWPTEGEARRSVSATGSNGLQIRGKRGQNVQAAAAGQVVYSGSGLRGYGQLLILKHDEVFLSAYAHNDALLVAEGARVERGQSIARMGDSGASEVMLHFEIRKGGKAVDPLEYLPPR